MAIQIIFVVDDKYLIHLKNTCKRMKEILAILDSYELAKTAGKRAALATVVRVEGSSYRRPGAKMLITDDGLLTGAISGGCLEGDALRKALSAINQLENKLVTYDTTDEDDAKFGVQLGCNGIVHILFEPIHSRSSNNPLVMLKELVAERRNAVLTTLFSLNGKNQLGTVSLYRKSKSLLATNLPVNELHLDSAEVLNNEHSIFKSYSDELEAFFEFIPPNLHLVIAGAGNDAQPLVSMASVLGWQITVLDGRPAYASLNRFPNADSVLITKPENVFDHVTIDPQTVFVLMTHNYNYDLALMPLIMSKDFSYLGMLGPKKKLERMYNELSDTGFLITEDMKAKIHGPVGLDIGAETAEEIALSIVAEIKAVMTGRSAKFLKDKKAPIHVKEI
jgi:xanthine dehydrogenase accessory factor